MLCPEKLLRNQYIAFLVTLPQLSSPIINTLFQWTSFGLNLGQKFPEQARLDISAQFAMLDTDGLGIIKDIMLAIPATINTG